MLNDKKYELDNDLQNDLESLFRQAEYFEEVRNSVILTMLKQKTFPDLYNPSLN